MQTLAEAISKLEGDELVRVTAKDDPLNLGGLTFEALRRINRTVRKKSPWASYADVEDAVSEAILSLLEDGNRFQATQATDPGGLIVHRAGWVLGAFAKRRRIESIESLHETGGDAVFRNARPVVAPQPIARIVRKEKIHALERWTPDRIAAKLRWFQAEKGRVPTAIDCRTTPGMPDSTTIRKRFGSFNAALLAAGLMPNLVKRPNWTLESAGNVLRKHRQRTGGWPRVSDMEREPELPSSRTVRRLFGATTAAIYAPQIERMHTSS